MSGYIEHIGHEKCGSSDGLAVYQATDKSYNGYCWACGAYVADPYKDGAPPRIKLKKSPEQIDAEIAEIDQYPSRDVPARALRKETLEYFGVKVGVSEADGATPAFMYFPFDDGQGDPLGYKVKFLDVKQMYIVAQEKAFRNAHFFGWRQAILTGAKKLLIVEGEPDALALFQALKDRSKGSNYEQYNPAVVSLPSGASSAKKFIAGKLGDIHHHFKEIVLAFDKDEAGQAAAQAVLQIIPDAKVAILPGKDANECVIGGRSKALAEAVLFKSSTPKNTRVILADELFEAASQPPEWGMSTPWPKMTELTRGFRFGETHYLGAGVKMGKSELVNALGKHLIIDHGLKVFMAKPEEANVKTIKMMASKVSGKIFHDPKIEFDKEAYNAAAEKLRGNLMLLNVYQHLGWKSLQTDIQHAVAEGAKAVFIDPITNLTNGVPSGEANTVLQDIAQSLSHMALDLQIMVFIFCHLKAPESGLPHEQGGKIYSSQFAGSRAMMRSCNYMWGLEGNKDEALSLEERNIRHLRLLEDREFGEVGSVPLYWNHKTGLFSQMEER